MSSPQYLVSPALAEMLNDCSIDRIMAIDLQWNIIAWNRTAEMVSGIRGAEILGRNLLEVFPQCRQDKELLQAMELAFSGIKSFVPAHRERFNRQHYENHFIPLKSEEGKLLGIMNIMHDVAHRIKAEQQLHKLNIALKKKYEQLERANEEQAQITYITSHNIKEPLRNVYSSLELLIRAEAKSLSDGGKANLRRMQSSLNRMNLLLDDIVALSGIHAPMDEGTPVDLNEVLQQVSAQLTEKLLSSDATVAAAVLPVVNGYKDILHYLFLYLMNNAIRFRPHQAPLRIAISSQSVTMPDNDPYEEGQRAFFKISVTDNGTGFEPEDAERIFLMVDKMPQKYASSGAGLAICRKIMLAHDGFIEAEGWPGKGAAFHCYFPLITG
ncbi:sensor histidine kinase [Paraflavitalea pollutisoli]|uniref:sensor histidine kinase n=1 Tax=Paraflavitalea pollutisoli TaxID=3034143 RepID=UPI0023EB4E38|nr:ATP-binding protein [Paraflavitalea sp. H1-2-19X]